MRKGRKFKLQRSGGPRVRDHAHRLWAPRSHLEHLKLNDWRHEQMERRVYWAWKVYSDSAEAWTGQGVSGGATSFHEQAQ